MNTDCNLYTDSAVYPHSYYSSFDQSDEIMNMYRPKRAHFGGQWVKGHPVSIGGVGTGVGSCGAGNGPPLPIECDKKRRYRKLNKRNVKRKRKCVENRCKLFYGANLMSPVRIALEDMELKNNFAELKKNTNNENEVMDEEEEEEEEEEDNEDDFDCDDGGVCNGGSGCVGGGRDGVQDTGVEMNMIMVGEDGDTLDTEMKLMMPNTGDKRVLHEMDNKYDGHNSFYFANPMMPLSVPYGNMGHTAQVTPHIHHHQTTKYYQCGSNSPMPATSVTTTAPPTPIPVAVTPPKVSCCHPSEPYGYHFETATPMAGCVGNSEMILKSPLQECNIQPYNDKVR